MGIQAHDSPIQQRRARGVLTLFGVAIGMNFVWEMVQVPLYQDKPFDEPAGWWLCFRAGIGGRSIVRR